MTCPYCGSVAAKVLSPWGWKYECAPCDARVGCHRGTDKPLGSLANGELRQARIAAHTAFDREWRDLHIPRSRAYGWLAKRLDLPRTACHIGMFTVAQCKHVVEIMRFGMDDMR